MSFFFCNCYTWGWSAIVPTRHCGHQWPIVPSPGDYDDGEIGGMIGRGNRSTRRKPAPMPLCPPQNPHAARTRTRAAAVGSQLRHGLTHVLLQAFMDARTTPEFLATASQHP
jgi:hypothetical protein